VLAYAIGAQGRSSADNLRGRLSPWQVKKVRAHVAAHLDQALKVDDLATLVQLSSSYFSRAFAHTSGLTPHAFIMLKRIEWAKVMLIARHQAFRGAQRSISLATGTFTGESTRNPCVDASRCARKILTFLACDRVRSCVRPHSAAFRMPQAGMEIRGSGPNHFDALI